MDADPVDPSPAEVVRAYCDAWMAGDVVAVVDFYHDDLTLHWPGRHRFAGTYSGQQASIEALLVLQGVTNRQPFEIVDVLASDGGAVAVVRERWSNDSGAAEPSSIEITRALHFTVLDAKLHTCRIFEFDQPLIDDWLAAGD